MNKNLWKQDWFAGLLISLLFLLAANTDLLQSLERKAYDIGVAASSRNPGDKIAIIAIDDASIANIGRWPWPRDVHAKMTDLLSGQAKVIGNTAFFIEPQLDPGLKHIDAIADFVAKSGIPSSADGPQLDALIKTAQDTLNTDRKLAESIKKAGNVVLAMPFTLGEPQGKPDKPLPETIVRNSLGKVVDPGNGNLPLPAIAVLPPIPEIAQTAAAIGHLNVNPDVDGAIRTEPLVVRYYDQFYPSLALQIAARYLNLQPKDIQARLGEGVKLGNLNIATDSALQMHTFFYSGQDGKSAFPQDSFFDVIEGKVPASKYAGKIVLIGATATGVGANQVTPISPAMAPVQTLAHTVASILNQHFFVVPNWAPWAERLAWLLVALYLILALPRLKAGTAAAITAALLAALLLTHFVLMTQQGLWLQLMLPATLLLVGHLLLTTKRFLVTERGKEKSEAESAENNRSLGLMFQGQGQLDMAFDKLRKCPMDDSLMDLLYNLALDFERKRQFNKAESVFGYMAEYNPKFRDLEQRLARSKAMAETVILGGTSGGRSNASILTEGGIEKPMLGRYQVEKELGKGAMGVVYLGSDPKISRTVAIKTMALAQEFEPDELADVKERFFREAETAGRLNHPNIVTMYDAGEEHDLCYIAMEFLKGKDLVPYTKPGQLLPIPRVMDIVLKVADALDYAHLNNVVHRDIKPANIMYEVETGVVKVTDFGIARITDSSRTKTGMVLGTPSYMSPEQLSGKKVDGRSDLFSLGVMFYQLVTGQLPFVADSMAALMFKIANDPHPAATTLRPELPPCLSAIIDKMLTKDADQRYQRGTEIAADLRKCWAVIKAGIAKK
ncbi:eukaryotic-like serine/threonine-protein kinase [Novimethylophilus kurashikiensis]|uniref:non-specific serine/threonine protein kinase n=1 Tax=Novimethylophilus kurashikiensis TaxID=1825523 RepID=A0A2R5F4Q6_9PROT|nr:serine/threonine-protein kinase [Novimethylophilus kurashikiensis]GBG13386.1 eukaryotic-like serine/threonine-protein kinase [Novimethylophilus kurashikiensis]